MKIWVSPTRIWGLQLESGGLHWKSRSLQQKYGVSITNLGVSKENLVVFNENLWVSNESMGFLMKICLSPTRVWGSLARPSCGSPIVLQWQWFLPRLLFILYLLIDLHVILRYNNFVIFHQILKIFQQQILICFLVCAKNYICFFCMYNIFWYVFLPFTMNPTQSFSFV